MFISEWFYQCLFPMKYGTFFPPVIGLFSSIAVSVMGLFGTRKQNLICPACGKSYCYHLSFQKHISIRKPASLIVPFDQTPSLSPSRTPLALLPYPFQSVPITNFTNGCQSCFLCNKPYKKKHTCKANHLKIFNFSDDFFTERAEHESLYTGFIGGHQSTVLNCCKSFTWSLAFALFNINNIHQKFHEISFILDKQLADGLVIDESKINDSISSKIFECPYYNLYRRDLLWVISLQKKMFIIFI